jgi:tetratricopeptide (TPR) repeat protein
MGHYPQKYQQRWIKAFRMNLKLPLILIIGFTCSIFGNRIHPEQIQAQTPSVPEIPTNETLSAEEHFKRGSVTRAIQIWSKDIKNGNDILRVLYNRSQAYVVIKQYESALQDLNQLIRLQGAKTSTGVYIIRGIALSELNRLPEAIEDFNQAERLESSYLIYANRGLAYQKLQQYPQALQDLSKSVKLAPTAIAKLNLANVRIKLNQFAEVIDEMNQLLDKEKVFFPAYMVRGIAYYNLGQYEASIRDCLYSLKIAPDQAEAYYYAGLSFAKLNRKEDAAQNLIRSADIYLRQNQADSYRQVLEKMSELNLQ